MVVADTLRTKHEHAQMVQKERSLVKAQLNQNTNAKVRNQICSMEQKLKIQVKRHVC